MVTVISLACLKAAFNIVITTTKTRSASKICI